MIIMDDEIEYIKRKKMIEYMRKALEHKKTEVSEPDKEDIYEKVKPIFAHDAYEYLISLKKSKPDIALKIINTIVYLGLNGLINIPVDKLTIEVLERKAEGYKGRIYVERKGKFVDFGDALRKED